MSISDILSFLALMVSLWALRDARKVERNVRRQYVAERREDGLARVRELEDEIRVLRHEYASALKSHEASGVSREGLAAAFQQAESVLLHAEQAAKNARQVLSEDGVLTNDAVDLLRLNTLIEESRHSLILLRTGLVDVRERISVEQVRETAPRH